VRQPGLAQPVDGAKKTRYQLLTLLARTVFLEQQVAPPLLETIDGLQRRMLRQIASQPKLLIGSQTVTTAPHQGNEAAVLGADAIQVTPASQEMMVHDADHVEAVSYDTHMRKV